jgi:hypothetical protein
MRINLVTGSVVCNSHAALMQALKDGKDFIIHDINKSDNGLAINLMELHASGYKRAQIRYGKRHEKVWYGDLPVVK